MSVLLIEKKNIAEPMAWFREAAQIAGNWQKDPLLNGYNLVSHGDTFYYCAADDTETFFRFEDFSNNYFEFVDTAEMIDIAKGRELIFGYFSDDTCSAEFLHIKGGKCIREFREYSDYPQDNVDLGCEPAFSSWADVASYVERM